MAEFKTAEQYVVDKLEILERKYENAKLVYQEELARVRKELEDANCRYNEVTETLDMFRDFITVSHNDYFGNCIYFDTIYGKDNPEEVARIMEYFDMRPEEDESDD